MCVYVSPEVNDDDDNTFVVSIMAVNTTGLSYFVVF